MEAFGTGVGAAGVGFDSAGLSKKEKSAVAHTSDFAAVGDVGSSFK